MAFEYHDKLNSKFWKDFRLDKKTSSKLVDIALDFYRGLKTNAPLEDIEFTGSLTNYTYTNKSDIDLHLKLDFSKVKAEPEVTKQLFEGEKYKWNLNHDIHIKDHPIEIYIEDVAIKPYATKPVYSLLNNQWIQKPVYNPPKIDEQNVNKKYESFKDEIDSLISLFHKTKDKNQFRLIHNRAKKIKEKLSTSRKECMKDKTVIFDFCIENLVFKKLRDAGYLDKLNDLKNESYDKIFTEQTWNPGLHALFMSDLIKPKKQTKQIMGYTKKQPRHRKDFIRDPGTRKHVQTIPTMHQNTDHFKEIGMLKKIKGRRIVSEPRAFEIAKFYNIQIKETPTRLGRSSVSIKKQGNIYVLESE